MSGRRAVFLDRDNTLNHDPGYLSDPGQVRLLPGVAEGLRLLRERGFLLVLISNQSGVGRGLFSADDLARVHARLAGLLGEQGLTFDDVRYCLHAPWEDCACRKPRPGMILEAALALGADLAGSFMVGDKLADVEAGRRAGCRTVLVGGAAPTDDCLPDAACPDLLAAARWIVAQNA